MEFSDILRVPKDRVAVLIGKKGETRNLLCSRLKVRIFIDSIEAEVKIVSDDSLNLMIAKAVVKAVGRGFNPEIALKLVDERYAFDIIDMTFFTKSKSRLLTIKARIIGQEGKSRKNISRITGTDIVIYGKTVGVIGPVENVATAKRAIDALLSGRKHATVYHWLEDKQRSPR